MNPVDALFARLRAARRKAFLPFLTAGDPNPATTLAVARRVVEAGADALEIGIPYSDPIADGPVIQASYSRALSHGLRLADVFATVRELASTPLLMQRQTPLLAMVSYSIVHRRGHEEFVRQAREAGFSGAIVPDLPVDESEALSDCCAARDFKLIHLITPTTPRDRALQVARRSTGFLYCVSVTGITGERDRLPPELLEQLDWLRSQTDLPLCVGFGVSKPEQAQALREHVDGVIVGSALVRRVEQIGKRPLEEVLAEIEEFTRAMVAALNPATVQARK